VKAINRDFTMWEAGDIPLTLNEFALRELRFTLIELGLCTTLAQARGVIHSRIEEYEKSNEELKGDL